MMWDIFNLIGTIAFALSGVLVALEEKYDLMGAYVLGFATAFGGGALRNLFIGIPVSALWVQGTLFTIAFIIISFAFFTPKLWIPRWKKSGYVFDAIGLSAFAIQGAIFATEMNHPLSAIIAASVFTGTGGGIVRDMLAGRKPIVLRKEIYILWAIIGGVFIGLGWVTSNIGYICLFIILIILRMLSIHYGWKVPTIKSNY